MVFLTGDIHGDTHRITKFAETMQLSREDVVIILGDVGVNYYGDFRDTKRKEELRNIDSAILCIHGNHEFRPHRLESYKLIDWNGGKVWVETDYPNLLFAKDGEIYTIDGIKYIAIGGAYSIDKYYRLRTGLNWFEDEQPSDDIKKYVESQLRNNRVDVILSHTCPLKYEPIEVFLPGIDQRSVDKSTEQWLDSIESSYAYKAWFCGHFHINKRIDKLHFLFEGFVSSDSLKGV